MAITVNKPELSPSLNEYGPATITDESLNVLPVEAVVFPDSSGNSGLPLITAVSRSQVTGKIQSPQSGAKNLPVKALVGLSGGNAVPLGAALAASVPAFVPDNGVDAAGVKGLVPASAIGDAAAGKFLKATGAWAALPLPSAFQSTVRTATGSAESIAHGLGVIPRVVLISIYDTNGVAVPYALSEGSHTTSNILVTVTASVKYKVIALA